MKRRFFSSNTKLSVGKNCFSTSITVGGLAVLISWTHRTGFSGGAGAAGLGFSFGAGGSGIASITAPITFIIPAVSVTKSCFVAGNDTAFPFGPKRAVISAVTAATSRLPNGNRTLTNSKFPRSFRSSSVTTGTIPRGMPSDKSMTINICSLRISVKCLVVNTLFKRSMPSIGEYVFLSI